MKSVGTYVLFIFVLLSSCKFFKQAAEPKEEVIARVGSSELYTSDVINIGAGIPPQDSVAVLNGYINNWIRRKLFLQKAEENLDKQLGDLDKRIADYRESLIIYNYENELIKQKLDTNVLEDEMRKYYTNNSKEFELKSEVYRLKYVKIKKGNLHTGEISKLLVSENFEDVTKLSALCRQHASASSIVDSFYQPATFMLQNFPISSYELKSLRGGKNVKQVTDDEFTYLLQVSETLITGAVAPYDMVKRDIRRIIQNKKKISFLENIYNQMYDEGQRDKKFEIFGVHEK